MGLQFKRRLTAPLDPAGLLSVGEIAFAKQGLVNVAPPAAGADDLVIHDGTAPVILVSAQRQVEVVGAQTIGGAKTLTAPLTLPGDPTAALHAATKQYVDAHASPGGVIIAATAPAMAVGRLWWDSAGGQLYVGYDDGTSQQWVIATTGIPAIGVTDAPQDATTYGRHGGLWKGVLPLTGGTLTGPIAAPQATFTSPSSLAAGSPPVVDILATFTHTGGTGQYYAAHKQGTIYGKSSANIWLDINRLLFSGDPATTGEMCAGYDQMLRYAAAPGQFNWGRCIEYRDLTGLGSQAGGGGQTLELDWFGNGLDDMTAQTGRTIAPFLIALHDPGGADLEVSYAITFNAGPRCSFKNCISARVPFSQSVLSTRSATQQAGGNAIWFRDGHIWSLNTAATSTLRYDTAIGTAHLTGGLQVDAALSVLGDLTLAEGKHFWLNAAHTSYLYYDPAELGVGGAHLAGSFKVDGSVYLLGGLTLAGSAYIAGGVSVQGDLGLADGHALWLNAAHTSGIFYDSTLFSGGGTHIVGALQADGQTYLPNNLTVGGLAYFGTGVTCHTDLGVSGNATFNRVTISLANNLAAAGTTLAGATALPAANNVVTSVPAGAGVALNPAMRGETIAVYNRGANPLLVYPQSASVAIDAGAVGAPYSLPAGDNRRFLLLDDGVHWLSS